MLSRNISHKIIQKVFLFDENMTQVYTSSQQFSTSSTKILIKFEEKCRLNKCNEFRYILKIIYKWSQKRPFLLVA